MTKIPVFNHSPHAVFIGGVMIPPGDTREVEETLHPGYRRGDEAPAGDEARHIVDVLLAGDEAALLAAIPTLAHEDLELLGEREQQGVAREAVLAAISGRLLEAAGSAADTRPASGSTRGGKKSPVDR